MRRLTEATLELLRAGLANGAMLPFTEAVVMQLSSGPVATAEEEATACRVLELIRAARVESVQDVAADLYASPALLAAFFQNLDLLFLTTADGKGGGDVDADAVSTVVMAALERAWA